MKTTQKPVTKQEKLRSKIKAIKTVLKRKKKK